MKSLFFPIFLLCFFISTITVNAQWIDAVDPPGGPTMALAGDQYQAWLFTYNLGFQTTLDEGLTWQLTYPTSSDIYVLAMRKMSNGDLLALRTPLAGGAQSTTLIVMQSTDNGYSWQEDTLCTNCSLGYTNSVNFYEQDGRWLLLGSYENLFRSDDHGQSWYLLTPTYAPNFTSYLWMDCNDGIVVGWLRDPTQLPQNGYPRTYVTSRDGGDTWETLTPPFTQNTCEFVGGYGIVTIHLDTVYFSIDGGLNFNTGIALQHSAIGHTIFEGPGDRICITIDANVGMDYLVSQDGGFSWQTVDNVPDVFQSIDLGGDRFLGCDDSSVKFIDYAFEYTENRSSDMHLNSIYAIETLGNTIYASSRSGYYRTQDGGNHWEELSNNFTVWALETPEKEIVAQGDTLVTITYKHLLISFDNGQSWSKYLLPADNYGGGLAIENGIITVSLEYNLYRSTDFGLTWSLVNLPNATQWEEMFLFEMGSTVCVAALDIMLGSQFYMSNDGGMSWQSRIQNNTHNLLRYSAAINNLDLITISNGSIYILSDSLLVSSDTGLTWHGILSIADYNYDAFYHPRTFLANDSLLIAGGEDGSVIGSDDGGQSWYDIILAPPGYLGYDYNLALVGDTLYAGFTTEGQSVMPEGGLFKFGNLARPGAVGTWPIPQAAAAFINVSPNPTPGSFTLELTAPAHLTIFNTLGEMVYQSQVEQNISHHDLSFLPNGVYYLSLKDQQGSQTEKLIIQK